ncbi:MAG: hypothetical protein ACE5E6_05155 [Phycisphaerae bacterium]
MRSVAERHAVPSWNAPGDRRRGAARRTWTWVTVPYYIGMATLCGCAAPRAVQGGAGAHVVMLPGITGAWRVPRLARLIDDEVTDTTAQVWDWTAIEPGTPLANLMDVERNGRRAGMLARQLRTWRGGHPSARLYLVAYSGGAELVRAVCDRLPEDFAIERVVFISAALSPRVDLGPVLRRSRLGVFNYYSAKDSVVLGLGTRLFGTSDRVHGASAGHVGFDAGAVGAEGSKLVQLPWVPEMRRFGNYGGHTGRLATGFFRRYVLPALGGA